ncbi:hypothetical protein J5X84_43495 [Streptosporangiaceae bacterium NEAU-GS5]|nr:hypothetical protein [Streptosporangiaceae bacterium NEAU-GS5]
MGPNEIDLIRIYTTEPGGQVADLTPLRNGGTTFDVVVEAEAGPARVDGAPYEVAIIARDALTGANLASYGTFAQSDKGTLSAPVWGKGYYEHRFNVDVSDINAVNGHVMDYVAVLHAAGGANTVHKFAVSPLFIVQQ